MSFRHLTVACIFFLACSAITMAANAEEPSLPGKPGNIESPDTPEDKQDSGDPESVALNLLKIISTLDEDADISANRASFTIADTQVMMIFDVNADRMRLISQIGPSGALNTEQLTRIMQANFDSALDARYAIAQGAIWSTFVHPLSSLTNEDFVSGISQTVTCVQTFGTTFSSGAMVFGGGDSQGEIEKLIEDLLKKPDTQA